MASYLILIIQFICLSLWVGGIAVILLVVAPTTFASLNASEAGGVMSPILRRFGSLFLTCLVVLTISFSVQLVLLSGFAALKLRIAMSLSSLAILFTVYDRYGLSPRLEHMRRTLDLESDKEGKKEFRRLHVRSMVLVAVNLFLGVLVVMILIAPLHRS
jgi:uncharacterized membrane protein